MVKSVPYFKDKGDSNSSAGWKVTTCFSFLNLNCEFVCVHVCGCVRVCSWMATAPDKALACGTSCIKGKIKKLFSGEFWCVCGYLTVGSQGLHCALCYVFISCGITVIPLQGFLACLWCSIVGLL